MTELDFSLLEGNGFQEKLCSAERALKGARGVMLRLPPGTYVVSTPFARKLMHEVLSGAMGFDPEREIFRPYYPYDTIFKLTDAKDVHIFAQGVKLMIDGFPAPMELMRCTGVTLEGLSIDYLRKPYSVGVAEAVGEDWVEVRYDAALAVDERTPAPRIVFFDEENRRFSGVVLESARAEPAGTDRVRYYGQSPILKGMNSRPVIAIHTYHYRPAIFLHECKTVSLKNIAIHAQCGMGVLGHRCEGIAIEGLAVVPSPGELISTNTDATHFTSCKGELTVKNSLFAGSEDDAINVHNYYYTIGFLHADRCDLFVEAPTFTHAQVVDEPDPGDELLLAERRTLAERGRYTVLERSADRDALCAYIRLNAPLPDDAPENCFLLNQTRQPRLIFRNNRVDYNLAKCVLVKTREALIEDCVFRASTGTAVHITPEVSWREGGGTGHVVLRRNRFFGTGFGNYARHGGASAICVEAQCEDAPSALVHGRIEILENEIRCEDAACAVSICAAREVVMEGNRIEGAALPIAAPNGCA
ncbi:MAG: right-handed parallel beta-helix repeat-containing protein [Clostridiaceae bacterium]|nr:right-handed parallel beta-helix repeat-containing protein [Eubacteriales bacterium]